MLSRTIATPSPRYHCSIPLSKVSANLLIKLCDLNTYINDEVLTYVITLPVVSRGTFEMFKLIAKTTPLESEAFLCIDTRNNNIIDKAEMCHCKTTTTESYVCTQSYVVMCSDWQETGAVELLEQRGNIVR